VFAGSGLSVFVIDRFASGVTVVAALAAFGVVGSNSVAVTEALLVIEPPAEGAVTVIVIAGAAPTASVVLVHVTVPETLLQVQPVPEADTNATPAGSVSTTETEFAVLGPALLTFRL
jgi:hypothetical protein